MNKSIFSFYYCNAICSDFKYNYLFLAHITNLVDFDFLYVYLYVKYEMSSK